MQAAGKGCTMLINKPLVVKERDADGRPSAFGWTPLSVDDHPPNVDNMRPDWQALISIIPDGREYTTITTSYYSQHDQSVAQRKLVEDPQARYLRANIWALKCQGDYAMGNLNRLPTDEMAHHSCLRCLIGLIVHPISIITQEERKERREKRNELIGVGLSHSEKDIHEAIEKEMTDKKG